MLRRISLAAKSDVYQGSELNTFLSKMQSCHETTDGGPLTSLVLSRISYCQFTVVQRDKTVECRLKKERKQTMFHLDTLHYDDVIMGTIASQITSLTIVYSTVYSGADQSKHQSSASLAFVWGIHRGPVNSTHKWPVTRKMFPFDDVIMWKLLWKKIENMWPFCSKWYDCRDSPLQTFAFS